VCLLHQFSIRVSVTERDQRKDLHIKSVDHVARGSIRTRLSLLRTVGDVLHTDMNVSEGYKVRVHALNPTQHPNSLHIT
jgi:uncharacterized lipoprotein YajG